MRYVQYAPTLTAGRAMQPLGGRWLRKHPACHHRPRWTRCAPSYCKARCNPLRICRAHMDHQPRCQHKGRDLSRDIVRLATATTCGQRLPSFLHLSLWQWQHGRYCIQANRNPGPCPGIPSIRISLPCKRAAGRARRRLGCHHQGRSTGNGVEPVADHQTTCVVFPRPRFVYCFSHYPSSVLRVS